MRKLAYPSFSLSVLFSSGKFRATCSAFAIDNESYQVEKPQLTMMFKYFEQLNRKIKNTCGFIKSILYVLTISKRANLPQVGGGPFSPHTPPDGCRI